jgi:hypothetical protein
MKAAIPNPKKTIEIDFSIEQIKNSMEFIPLKNAKYILFQKNEIVSQYTFHGKETLSLGVYIDINLSSISDSKTKIDIEVRRTVGAFDQSSEVTRANDHIQVIINLLSECLVLNDTEKNELIEKSKQPAEKKQFSWKSVAIFVISGIIFFFIFKTIFKTTPEKSICECYKWGQELSKKTAEGLAGTSEQMKAVEEESAKFKEECYEKMNPSKMSDTKKMLEEIEDCK